MQQSLRVRYKQSNHKASLCCNSPMSFVVAQALTHSTLTPNKIQELEYKVCWFNVQYIVFILQWCSQTIGVIYLWLHWGFFFFFTGSCVWFQSCGIPVPEQNGKGVREVVGSIWGLKDSKACVFSFETCRGAACCCRNVSQAPWAVGQIMPTLWIWHCESRPSAANSAGSSSPRLQENLYSYQKSNCRLIPLVWAWTASRKKGIRIPNHQLRTTAAFTKILVGNWR